MHRALTEGKTTEELMRDARNGLESILNVLDFDMTDEEKIKRVRRRVAIAIDTLKDAEKSFHEKLNTIYNYL